jgi:hypothetical protein
MVNHTSVRDYVEELVQRMMIREIAEIDDERRKQTDGILSDHADLLLEIDNVKHVWSSHR